MGEELNYSYVLYLSEGDKKYEKKFFMCFSGDIISH